MFLHTEVHTSDLYIYICGEHFLKGNVMQKMFEVAKSSGSITEANLFLVEFCYISNDIQVF